MEASTLGSGEIRLIIVVLQQHCGSINSMSRLDLAHAYKALRSKEKVKD